ncbi:MAG: nucleoside recognition domain-containing protein [Bacteroidota bacterium]
MLDYIWGLLLALGVLLASLGGRPETVTASVLRAAEGAVALVIALVGVIALWTGLMRVAEDAGLPRLVARVLRPVLACLFPSIPRDHPALGAIAMSISGNLLGLGNASTPLGLKAIRELQHLNPSRDEPSDAQCTYLCLVMGGLTLVPATVIALRARYQSAYPTASLGPTLCATLAGTAAALAVDWAARSIRRRRKAARRH